MSITIACTAGDIDMTFERWNEIMSWPDLCQQFGCSREADRECGWCRALFCGAHATHDCLRGQRTIDEWGEAA